MPGDTPTKGDIMVSRATFDLHTDMQERYRWGIYLNVSRGPMFPLVGYVSRLVDDLYRACESFEEGL